MTCYVSKVNNIFNENNKKLKIFSLNNQSLTGKAGGVDHH